MKTEVMATMVGGLLKPDTSLPLPDQSRVKITIETIDAEPTGAAAWQALMDRLALRPVHGGGKRFTRDQLHERR